MGEREVNTALRAVANAPTDGALDERLEAAIDAPTKRLITALAGTLGGNPRMGRSKAARLLLRKGAEALLAERQRTA